MTQRHYNPTQRILVTGSAGFLGSHPCDPLQRQPDITLARGKLGWEPTVPLREGLVQTIAYFDQLLSSDPAGARVSN